MYYEKNSKKSNWSNKRSIRAVIITPLQINLSSKAKFFKTSKAFKIPVFMITITLFINFYCTIPQI